MSLYVDSVTGVDVALAVAGPGARAFAFVLDWSFRAILAIAWYVVAAPLYNHALSLHRPAELGRAPGLHFVVAPAVRHLSPLSHRAGSPDERPHARASAWRRVRIVARDGATAIVGALLVRNVFRVIDGSAGRCMALGH